MTTMPEQQAAKHRLIDIDGAQIESFQVCSDSNGLCVAASHPADVFNGNTANFLAGITQTSVVCINQRGLGQSSPTEAISLEQMVDDIESVRLRLALPPWVFWGMSGGGWLSQIYALRHPNALAGIIVESACVSFRARLADPECALSPFFPAWRNALQTRGLLAPDSHSDPSPVHDAEWVDVEEVGQVFRRRGGPALLVSPMPIDQHMKRAMPQLWSFDSRDWIKELRIPALVLAGDSDPVVPVHRVRQVHEAIPESTFVVVKDGGHVPSSEQHGEAMAAVRRFLMDRERA